MEPTKRPIKVVEGAYSCFIHYRVNPLLLETPELQHIAKALPGRHFETLHLSMSKSFQLTHSYVQHFLNKLRQSLSKYECLNIILLLGSCVVLNDRFIAFTVREPTKSKLTEVLTKIDKLLEEFGFEKYYSPPIFHISVAEINPNDLEVTDVSKYSPPKISTALTEFILQVGEKQFKIW